MLASEGWGSGLLNDDPRSVLGEASWLVGASLTLLGAADNSRSVPGFSVNAPGALASNSVGSGRWPGGTWAGSGTPSSCPGGASAWVRRSDSIPEALMGVGLSTVPSGRFDFWLSTGK